MKLDRLVLLPSYNITVTILKLLHIEKYKENSYLKCH